MRKRVFCLGILVILMPIFFGCLDDVSKLGCSGDTKKQDMMQQILQFPHIGKIGIPCAAIAGHFGYRLLTRNGKIFMLLDMLRNNSSKAVSLFPFFMLGYYFDDIRRDMKEAEKIVNNMRKKE